MDVKEMSRWQGQRGWPLRLKQNGNVGSVQRRVDPCRTIRLEGLPGSADVLGRPEYARIRVVMRIFAQSRPYRSRIPDSRSLAFTGRA